MKTTKLLSSHFAFSAASDLRLQRLLNIKASTSAFGSGRETNPKGWAGQWGLEVKTVLLHMITQGGKDWNVCVSTLVEDCIPLGYSKLYLLMYIRRELEVLYSVERSSTFYV